MDSYDKALREKERAALSPQGVAGEGWQTVFDAWFKKFNSWDLSGEDFLRLSFVQGELGAGRINGFDDKEGDTVWVSPSGSRLTRHQCNRWRDKYESYSTGWKVCLEHISAAPPPQSQREGWQPIETAPKDGTTIFGVDAKWGNRGMVHFNAQGEWEFVDGMTNLPAGHGFHPTHWHALLPQPVPTPIRTET